MIEFFLDRSNGEQHIVNFDQTNENESRDLEDDDDYDDELLIMEEILYGTVGEPSNVEQAERDAANGSTNPDDAKIVIDDETFIEYMTNNHLIRDDWGFKSQRSKSCFYR